MAPFLYTLGDCLHPLPPVRLARVNTCLNRWRSQPPLQLYTELTTLLGPLGLILNDQEQLSWKGSPSQSQPQARGWNRNLPWAIVCPKVGPKSQHNPRECPLTYPTLCPHSYLSRSNVLCWATPQRFPGNWGSYTHGWRTESSYPMPKFSELSIAHNRPSSSTDLRNWNFTTRFIFVF